MAYLLMDSVVKKIKNSESKMKELDERIEMLKYELYKKASTLKCLKKENIEITKYVEKLKPVHKDLFFYPDIFSYFYSFQDILNQNVHFSKILAVLKNEMYAKPKILLNEKSLLSYITLSEKEIYSQWILQTIIEKLSNETNRKKCDSDSSLETISYLRKIMFHCNIPVANVFAVTLNALNNISFKVLSDNEQDLLIFMHAVARIQGLFELMKAVEFSHDSTQLLTSKAERYEIQKHYLKLVHQLKSLIDGMANINISKVFHALTKSNDARVKAEEVSEAYEHFKHYVTHASGQVNGILDLLQSKEAMKASSSVEEACQKMDSKIKQCIDQGTETVSENLDQILKYDIFQKAVESLVHEIKEFIQEMLNMTINSIEDARKHLNCLKSQIKFALQSKWNLQKLLLPSICKENDSQNIEVLHITGCSQLLFEYIKDVIFNLKILQEIEFSKHFSVMSNLSKLKEKKDLLIEKFRNFVLRTGHQKLTHFPLIKRDLVEFNKEIQILFTDYHKFRFKLQFLNVYEERNVQSMFKDIEAIVMANAKTYKIKRSVGSVGLMLPLRRKNLKDFEAKQRKTKAKLEDVNKNVDETMDFLHLLDETIISKNFCTMRYLCELHCVKKQILSSFENLLLSMFKLRIEDDEDFINRLMEINSAADSLIRKYETVGMQLMLFSEIIAISREEKEENICEIKNQSSEVAVTNISDLFGTTNDLKKLHYPLDNAVQYKWFPAKQNLSDMLIDKERVIQSFKNFLERMPELDLDNTMDVFHSLRQLIMNAENLLRKYQSLRMQLIWIAGGCVFDIKNS